MANKKFNILEADPETDLIVRRVPYGKDKTALKDREYTISSTRPVGTMSEIKEFVKDTNYKRIIAMDKNFEEVEQVYDIT